MEPINLQVISKWFENVRDDGRGEKLSIQTSADADDDMFDSECHM